jgi:hypothetical protein
MEAVHQEWQKGVMELFLKVMEVACFCITMKLINSVSKCKMMNEFSEG